MGKKQTGIGRAFLLSVTCIVMTSTLICGCGHLHEGFQLKSSFKEANEYFSQGSYITSLDKYKQILGKYPAAGDRVLFEMGVIYSHPDNWRKDYRKSLECFQQLIRVYPESEYRRAGEVMIAHIDRVTIKEKTITDQQTEIETLKDEIRRQGDEIASLHKKIEALEQEIRNKVYPIQDGPADRVVIEKKKRRLSLMSNGRILRQYRIALGGNPDGPKEKRGDNKTPEGIYAIDSRNRNSRYHLALHISYPNGKDMKRAKELGVSPGGNIMIHGIQNGLSKVGEFHTMYDWTKGCIAVTDEEIEEIDELVPDGTIVEIRP